MTPSQIVLEFSEKLSPGELAALPERLETYRASKFLTAIDDVGAGNANLMLLARLRPNFIKADVSLVKDVESNPFKRSILETLVLMAEKIGAQVISEGVESELALSSLVSMGVHAGQGRFLAEPAYPKPEFQVSIIPRANYRQAAAGEWKCTAPVGDLTTASLIVEAQYRVCDVKELLAGKPPMSSVVVVENDRPTGLLMNYNLDKALSAQFGIDLYSKKKVVKLMDPNPLCVEFGMPIEEAARMAMNRDPNKIYDDIIVTREGILIGTVSVQKMLDTLAKVQVELAKGSNPLTGLPGNVAIEQEFNRRSEEAAPSCLIYIDLDHFKVYNDVYGFNQGDKVILLTAKVLRDVVKSCGAHQDFVGHVGGDDFVVISARDTAEAIARRAIDIFAEESPKLYTPEDQQRGYICGSSRGGEEQCFPLITMSIGILDCVFQVPVAFAELSHRVAEVKKLAKSPLRQFLRARPTRPPSAPPPVRGRCSSDRAGRPASFGDRRRQREATRRSLAARIWLRPFSTPPARNPLVVPPGLSDLVLAVLHVLAHHGPQVPVGVLVQLLDPSWRGWRTRPGTACAWPGPGCAWPPGGPSGRSSRGWRPAWRGGPGPGRRPAWPRRPPGPPRCPPWPPRSRAGPGARCCGSGSSRSRRGWRPRPRRPGSGRPFPDPCPGRS